jgi:hypothetical protein
MSFPSPDELDKQVTVQISRWIELYSEECRMIDDNYDFTMKLVKMLLLKEPAYLFTDSSGRIFGKGQDGTFYPFHTEYQGKLVGYKISKRAAN